MLVKAGVDISRLNRDIRRALHKVNHLYDLIHQELIVSSTYEGNHSAGSLHYANDAFDIIFPNLHRAKMTEDIRCTLGRNYDVVMETTHIHIEYDPKKGV